MKPKTLYIILRSFMGLGFHLMFITAAIYRITIAELELYQLILTGTALEIAVFLFETPTGVVADLKSRKLSIIIGFFIIGLGFIFEVLTTHFYMIFIAQIIWGLGYTFISGALESWLSDETNNEEVEKVIIVGAQYHKLFTVLGILLAMVIGYFDIRLGIYVAGFIFLGLGVFTLLVMKEHPFEKHGLETTLFASYYSQLKRAFTYVKEHKVLRIMFVILLFYGLYSEGLDRTYERYILYDLNMVKHLGLPEIWVLGIVDGLIAVIGFIMLDIVKRYVSTGRHVLLWLFNMIFMMIIGLVLFAFLPFDYFAVLAFMFFSISREGSHPLLDTIIIRSTPSKIKATVLSGFGQLDAIGQLLSGAIMVLVLTLVGLKGMYLFTASLMIVPLFLVPLMRNYYQHDE